jgi:hypothetical protein
MMEATNLPEIDNEDQRYVLIWDANKRIFLTCLPIESNEIKVPKNISRFPSPYPQLEEKAVRDALVAKSKSVCRVMFEKWSLLHDSYEVYGLGTGIAVGPSHVITLSHFPNNTTPSRVCVVLDDTALPTLQPISFRYGQIEVRTLPDSALDSVVLITLESPFFDTWLKPSLVKRFVMADDMFAVVYNGEPDEQELKRHYRILSAQKQEGFLHFPH